MRGNGPLHSHAWSKLGGSCQPHKGMGSGRWTKGLQGFFRKFFAFCYSPEQVCISSSSSTKLRKPPKLPQHHPCPPEALLYLGCIYWHGQQAARLLSPVQPLLLSSVPAALRVCSRESRKEERAHQLVTVQKQMYIPAQNSDVSISNYFETALCSHCLIPKALLSFPPASYLCCSLTAPLLLIIKLSLLGLYFRKHPSVQHTAAENKKHEGELQREARLSLQRQHREDARPRSHLAPTAHAPRNYRLSMPHQKQGKESA